MINREEKNMKKRLLSLLLAVAMLFGLMPTTVYASTNSTIDLSIEYVAYGGYLYSDPIHGTQQGTWTISTEEQTAILMESAPLFESIEEAAEYLKTGLKEYAESISMQFDMSSLGSFSDIYEVLDEIGIVSSTIWETAIVHDVSDPTGGDYLRYQMAHEVKMSVASSTSEGITNYTAMLTYTPGYWTSYEQENNVTEQIQQILEDLNINNKNDYEKVLAVYQYICQNVTYDYDNLEEDSYYLKYTAYAALMNGTAVCQGYANLLYRMLLESGVDCRIVSGFGNSEPHAWNIIKLGDAFYNVDVTWDSNYDEPDEYEYFLRCNGCFEDHVRDEEYNTDEFNAAYPMTESDYDPQSEHESHNYVEISREGADCIGWTVIRECSECGESYEEYLEPTVEHSYEESYREGSDCSGWYVEYECTECGDSYGEDIEGTGGHNYVETYRVESTVTEPGCIEYICTSCGESSQSTIPPRSDYQLFSVVLSWGESPSDLDSIFIGNDTTSSFQVDYTSMTYSGENAYVSLDVDDTSSFGPETTDVYLFRGQGFYSFYVHDFSNGDDDSSTEMAYSGATVRIYYGESLVETVIISNDIKGTYWHVFDYDGANKSLRILNTAAKPDETDSGICGGNLTWAINDEYVLTISGTGDMYDYDMDENRAPWNQLDNRSKITSVIIEDGVNRIGDCAFAFLYNLSSVDLPKSLASVGINAFHGEDKIIYYSGSSDQWSDIRFNLTGVDYLEDAFVLYDGASRDIMDGTYGFENYGVNNSLQSYVDVLGPVYGGILHPIYGNKGMKGQCYGMAVTAAIELYYGKPVIYENGRKARSLLEITNRFDWYTKDDRLYTENPISSFIEYAFVYQLNSLRQAEQIAHALVLKMNIENLVSAVEEYLVDGKAPVIIEISDNGARHALLPLAIDFNEKEAKILIYDCNKVGVPTILHINRNENGGYNGWTYPEWGCNSSEKGVSITYDSPVEGFYSLYSLLDSLYLFEESDLEDPSNNLLTVSNQSTTVSTANMEYLLTPEVEETGIIPIRISNGTEDDAGVDCYWVNVGNEISLTSSDEGGSYVFATYDSGIGVEMVGSSTAILTIGENDSNNSVSLTTEAGEPFSISFYGAEGEKLVTTTVSGTAASGNVLGAMTENGVLLDAGDLSATVTLKFGDETVCEYSFACDKESVFLMRTEENEIVALIDKDGNGTYETPIDEANAVSVTELVLSIPLLANISKIGEIAWFSFSPMETDYYRFFSTGAEDTFVELYDSNSNPIASDDDSGNSNNFSLVYQLEAGNTYYYKPRFYADDSTGSFPVTLVKYKDNQLTATANDTGGYRAYMFVPQGDDISIEVHVSAEDTSEITYYWERYTEGSAWEELGDIGAEVEVKSVTGFQQYKCNVLDQYGNPATVWFNIQAATRLTLGEQIALEITEDADLDQDYYYSFTALESGKYSFCLDSFGGYRISYWNENEETWMGNDIPGDYELVQSVGMASGESLYFCVRPFDKSTYSISVELEDYSEPAIQSVRVSPMEVAVSLTADVPIGSSVILGIEYGKTETPGTGFGLIINESDTEHLEETLSFTSVPETTYYYRVYVQDIVTSNRYYSQWQTVTTPEDTVSVALTLNQVQQLNLDSYGYHYLSFIAPADGWYDFAVAGLEGWAYAWNQDDNKSAGGRISEDGQILTMSLDKGEVMYLRIEPYQLGAFTVLASDSTFVPTVTEFTPPEVSIETDPDNGFFAITTLTASVPLASDFRMGDEYGAAKDKAWESAIARLYDDYDSETVQWGVVMSVIPNTTYYYRAYIQEVEIENGDYDNVAWGEGHYSEWVTFTTGADTSIPLESLPTSQSINPEAYYSFTAETDGQYSLTFAGPDGWLRYWSVEDQRWMWVELENGRIELTQDLIAGDTIYFTISRSENGDYTVDISAKQAAMLRTQRSGDTVTVYYKPLEEGNYYCVLYSNAGQMLSVLNKTLNAGELGEFSFDQASEADLVKIIAVDEGFVPVTEALEKRLW
mgnify:CR=1 FL=1